MSKIIDLSANTKRLIPGIREIDLCRKKVVLYGIRVDLCSELTPILGRFPHDVEIDFIIDGIPKDDLDKLISERL